MKKGLFFLEKVCAVFTLFLLPTQLAFHFWPSYAFVFGIRVDYLSPAVYLTDIFILILLVALIVNSRAILIKFLRQNKNYLLFFLIFVVFNTLTSSFPPVTAFRWFKFFEAAFFGLYIYLRKSFLGEKLIFGPLFLSAVLFSLIGIAQFFLGRTTGLFYLFGERSFDLTSPGIALVQIKGVDFLRAYSTFSHPNSLAGYLGIVLIISLFPAFTSRKTAFYLGLLIISLAFLLTFSLSALLALIVLGVFCFLGFLQKKKRNLMKNFLCAAVFSSLLLPVVSAGIFKNYEFPLNVVQRLDLSVLAGKMIASRFWTGWGLNTFILNSPGFLGLGNPSWFLQPVHNIFLLILSETGIPGTVLVFILLYKLVDFSFRKRADCFTACLFFVLFTGLTDHYWLTLQQNLLVLAVVGGYCLRSEE